MLTKPIYFRIWQFKLFQTRPQDKWLFDRVTQQKCSHWKNGGCPHGRPGEGGQGRGGAVPRKGWGRDGGGEGSGEGRRRPGKGQGLGSRGGWGQEPSRTGSVRGQMGLELEAKKGRGQQRGGDGSCAPTGGAQRRQGWAQEGEWGWCRAGRGRGEGRWSPDDRPQESERGRGLLPPKLPCLPDLGCLLEAPAEVPRRARRAGLRELGAQMFSAVIRVWQMGRSQPRAVFLPIPITC